MYIIHYDICAIFILILNGLIFYSKRNIPLSQNKIFPFFIFLGIFTFLLNLVIIYSLNNPNVLNHSVKFLTNIYGISISFITFLYGHYCFSFFSYEEKFKKHSVLVRILFLFFCASAALFAINCFHPFIFDITSSNEIIHLKGMSVLQVFICLHLIVFAVILYSEAEFLNKTKFIFLISPLLVFFISLFIQSLCRYYVIYGFMYSINLFFIYFFVQRNNDYIDSNSAVFNQNAFLLITKKMFSEGKDFNVICLTISDFSFMNRVFGHESMNIVVKKICAFLISKKIKAPVFYLPSGNIVITTKEKEDVIMAEMKKYTEYCSKTYYINNAYIKPVIKLSIIPCPLIATQSDDILEIINFISENSSKKADVFIDIKELDLNQVFRSAFIEKALDQAMKEHLFDVYYQPIYSVNEFKIIGAEALVRLTNENIGFISPEEFIPIAEKNGHILHLGEYVFEKVCQFLQSIDVDYYGISKIDVNLSVIQCMEPNFSDMLLRIISTYNIPKELLNCEITETAAISFHEVVLKNLKQLENEGIEISLDDYGSGYANMNYLLSLPLKMIKIDKYIVWEAHRNKKASIALDATISMIHSLGMTVLAEGVESFEQAEWLISIGCDYLQGFYFSEPLKKQDFLNLLLQNKGLLNEN